MNIRRWLAGAVSAAAVTAGFAAAPAAAAATHLARHEPLVAPFFAGTRPAAKTPGTIYNGSWAGYGAVADPGVQLRYSAVNFTVTSLDSCYDGAEPSEVSQLAALGGITSPAEMAGVIETCQANGTVTVQGFYQIEGTDSISTAPVSAGDAISASVYYDVTTGEYTFTVTDATQGDQVIDATVACPTGDVCANGSAEAVTALSVPMSLAKYGVQNFTGGAVTSFDGTKGDYGQNKLWKTAEFGLGVGENEAYTFPLVGGSSFGTGWFTSDAPSAVARPTGHAPVATPVKAGGPPLARMLRAAAGSDWAGWVATAHRGVRLRWSTVTFNVPSLNCAGDPDGGAMEGAALGGVTGPILMTGVFETCDANGTYQIVPFYQSGKTVFETSGGVSAGDSVVASVYYNAGLGGYQFNLENENGEGPIIDNAFARCPTGSTCGNNTAEAITGLTENSVGTGLAPLADYGMDSLVGAGITSFDGTKGNYGSSRLWSSAPRTIDVGHGTQATTSALTGGQVFQTTWLASS